MLHEYESPWPEVFRIELFRGIAATAAAVATFDACVVGRPPVLSGGLVLPDGTVHDAIVADEHDCGVGDAVTVSAADALLPVSVLPMNTLLVVLV